MSAAKPLHLTNLNLIPMLRVLLREANVSRAAAHLGITQSAASGALARLRVLLGDPLLVRVGAGMRLTPRAEALAVHLEQVCVGLEALIETNAFDPHASTRRFMVAATDYEAALVAPAMTTYLRQNAPQVTAQFVEVPDRLAQRLALGEIDVALANIREPHGDTKLILLARDTIVGVVRRDHPLARLAAPSAVEIDAYPHVGWHPGLDMPPLSFSLSPAHPVKMQVIAQQFLMLPYLVARTDAVSQIPRALAEDFSVFLPLHIFELPYPTTPIETRMAWSMVQDADPAHRWFRDTLQTIMRDRHARRSQNYRFNR